MAFQGSSFSLKQTGTGPSTRHPDYLGWIDRWDLCRAAYNGAEAVKAGTDKYLPKPKAMRYEEYQIYLERASWYPMLSRTITGLIGLVFKKPPTLSGPSVLMKELEDINGYGTSLKVFAQNIFIDLMITGRVGIFLDFVNNSMRWSFFRTEDIVAWDTDGDQLKRVCLLERRTLKKNQYEYEQRMFLRELIMVEGRAVQNLFQSEQPLEDMLIQQPDGTRTPLAQEAKWDLVRTTIPVVRGSGLPRLPFVFCSSHSTEASITEPPLENLAMLNISHYITSADLEKVLYFVGNPTYVLRSDTKKVEVDEETKEQNIVVGSSRIVELGQEDSLEIVEHSGKGIEALLNRLKHKEDQAVTIGARLLEAPKQAVEAAAAVRARSASETSVLGSIADHLDSAMEAAMKIHALWSLGTRDADVGFKTNRDFSGAEPVVGRQGADDTRV